MKLSHRISFPGGKEFEQHECVFEISSEELSCEVFDALNPLQKFQVMNALVVINGLLYQRGEGYIDEKDYSDRKGRVISQLAEPGKNVFTEILKNG